MAARSSKAPAATAKRSLLRFEGRKSSLLPWPDFIRRVLASVALGAVVIGGSLAVGMLGYHAFEGLGAMDSFLNAAMILSGMGPLWSPHTDGGKLFAGLYALYSGLAVLVVAGLLFAPMIHRLLHRFHADEGDDSGQ